MSVPFSAQISQTSATFTHIDGKSRTILSSHHAYSKAMELINQIISGAEHEDDLRIQLYELTLPASMIQRITHGDVLIAEGKATYKGKEVNNVVVDRILWCLDQGQDPMSMVRFLNNLYQNPSFRAINELYRFMEANKMGITVDGYILAYKRVNQDYTSIYRGNGAEIFDNSIGKIVEMDRGQVNDNPNETCSEGLHVCSIEYLPSYRASQGKDRIVICKINPRDVVSVPIEYKNAKIRICLYEVVGEVDDSDGDVLGSKPVFDGWKETTWEVPSTDNGEDVEYEYDDDFFDENDSDEEEDNTDEDVEDQKENEAPFDHPVMSELNDLIKWGKGSNAQFSLKASDFSVYHYETLKKLYHIQLIFSPVRRMDGNIIFNATVR